MADQLGHERRVAARGRDRRRVGGFGHETVVAGEVQLIAVKMLFEAEVVVQRLQVPVQVAADAGGALDEGQER